MLGRWSLFLYFLQRCLHPPFESHSTDWLGLKTFPDQHEGILCDFCRAATRCIAILNYRHEIRAHGFAQAKDRKEQEAKWMGEKQAAMQFTSLMAIVLSQHEMSVAPHGLFSIDQHLASIPAVPQFSLPFHTYPRLPAPAATASL